jgi:hypothetical protein
MNIQKERFANQITRDKIQNLIDIHIFRKDTPEIDVLHYL